MTEWPLLQCYSRYQKATVIYKFSSDEEAQRLELTAYVVRWVGQWEAAFYWSLVWFPVEKTVCNCAFESWLGRTKKMSWQNDTLTGFLGCYDDAPRIATVNSQNATVIFSKCYYQVFCWVGNSAYGKTTASFNVESKRKGAYVEHLVMLKAREKVCVSVCMCFWST